MSGGYPSEGGIDGNFSFDQILFRLFEKIHTAAAEGEYQKMHNLILLLEAEMYIFAPSSSRMRKRADVIRDVEMGLRVYMALAKRYELLLAKNSENHDTITESVVAKYANAWAEILTVLDLLRIKNVVLAARTLGLFTFMRKPIGESPVFSKALSDNHKMPLYEITGLLRAYGIPEEVPVIKDGVEDRLSVLKILSPLEQVIGGG